jgi:hypothetical protein
MDLAPPRAEYCPAVTEAPVTNFPDTKVPITSSPVTTAAPMTMSPIVTTDEPTTPPPQEETTAPMTMSPNVQTTDEPTTPPLQEETTAPITHSPVVDREITASPTGYHYFPDGKGRGKKGMWNNEFEGSKEKKSMMSDIKMGGVGMWPSTIVPSKGKDNKQHKMSEKVMGKSKQQKYHSRHD